MNMEENSNKSVEKYNNYSKQDGSINPNYNGSNLALERMNDTYCSKCNNKVENYNMYCNNCGTSLEVIKNKNTRFIESEEEKTKFEDLLHSFNIKKSFMTSLLSVVVLLIISSILKFTLIGGNNQLSQLINPIHILLFSNLGRVDIYMSLFMNSSQSSINLGFLSILALPILSLAISYKIFMKNENISLIHHIRNSIGVGVTYGLMLCILAKMSQVGLNLSNGYSQGYSIYLQFSMISVLFKGFIIGFMSILFFGLKKEYEKENIIIKTLKLALKTVAIGSVVVLTILIVMNFANINYFAELGISSYKGKVNIGLILSQLAIYLWAFANLIPITIGSRTISVLSLLNSSISLDLILVLGAMIALSALIFIIVGCKLESKYNAKNGINPVIMFSGYYSIIMGLISIFTSLYIGNNVASMITSINAIQMGFSFVLSILISFIYSFLLTLTGFKLNIFN